MSSPKHKFLRDILLCCFSVLKLETWTGDWLVGFVNLVLLGFNCLLVELFFHYFVLISQSLSHF